MLNHLKPFEIHAGDRAPDVSPLTGPEGRQQRLYEILRGTKHTLLLTYRNGVPANLDHEGLKKWQHVLEPFLIVREKSSFQNERYKIILDPNNHFSLKYGLTSACRHISKVS